MNAQEKWKHEYRRAKYARENYSLFEYYDILATASMYRREAALERKLEAQQRQLDADIEMMTQDAKKIEEQQRKIEALNKRIEGYSRSVIGKRNTHCVDTYGTRIYEGDELLDEVGNFTVFVCEYKGRWYVGSKDGECLSGPLDGQLMRKTKVVTTA